MRVVIDCNVLVAANDRDVHPSRQCIANCASQLLATSSGDILLEDTANLIWSEYKTYCHFNGQPGPGDRFFLWYLQNRWTPERVERIEIGSKYHEVESRIPPGLKGFDPSDRKWIATFLVGDGDVLYNAMDSDWRENAPSIQEAGITVVELCPADLRMTR